MWERNKNDNRRIDKGKGDEIIFFKSFREGDLSSLMNGFFTELMNVRKFLGILWTSLTS
jgi:hypothetical protein